MYKLRAIIAILRNKSFIVFTFTEKYTSFYWMEVNTIDASYVIDTMQLSIDVANQQSAALKEVNDILNK